MVIKWKDLEFVEIGYKEYKVDLNGHDYWLLCKYDDDMGDNIVRLYDSDDNEACSFNEEFVEEVNFFNNLELELIEVIE